MCVNRRLGKGKGRVDTFCHGTAYFCHAAIIVLPAYHYCIKVFFQHAPAQPNQPSSSSPSLSPLSPPSHSHNMTARIWLRHYPAPPDQDKQDHQGMLASAPSAPPIMTRQPCSSTQATHRPRPAPAMSILREGDLDVVLGFGWAVAGLDVAKLCCHRFNGDITLLWKGVQVNV